MTGQSMIYSGYNGTLLYQLSGGAPLDEFGMTITSLGDINKDSIPDFALLAKKNKTVHVYSGADVSLLFSLNNPLNSNSCFGISLGNPGDINNDGFDDIMIGDTCAIDNRGKVYIYSGSNQSLLMEKTGTNNFGYSMTKIGDIDLDNHSDIAVLGYQSVHIISGQTQTVLKTLTLGDLSMMSTLRKVAQIGDLNKDGVQDFAIFGIPSGAYGEVVAISGSNFSILFRKNDRIDGAGSLVFSASDTFDYDSDGYNDFILADEILNRVSIYSGKDQSLIDQIQPIDSKKRQYFFGHSVNIMGNIHGSKKGAILVNQLLYEKDCYYVGRVHAYQLK